MRKERPSSLWGSEVRVEEKRKKTYVLSCGHPGGYFDTLAVVFDGGEFA
jgi:hypothetical protein